MHSCIPADRGGHIFLRGATGASGDLAKKKTYPVLFSLYLHGLLPPNAIIYGFARSKLDDADFKKQISRQYDPATSRFAPSCGTCC